MPARSSASPASPATARANCSRCSPASVRPSQGRILLDGKDVDGFDAATLRELGLAHVPEDRQRMGLVTAFPADENAILGYQRRSGASAAARFARPRPHDRRPCRARCAAYDVRPPDPRLKTAKFSGGNQQKIVLAREIERDPKVLLVGQPTRGVDIGAIEFIHRRLIALRDAGEAILLVSVELEEIMALVGPHPRDVRRPDHRRARRPRPTESAISAC